MEEQVDFQKIFNYISNNTPTDETLKDVLKITRKIFNNELY